MERGRVAVGLRDYEQFAQGVEPFFSGTRIRICIRRNSASCGGSGAAAVSVLRFAAISGLGRLKVPARCRHPRRDLLRRW